MPNPTPADILDVALLAALLYAVIRRTGHAASHGPALRQVVVAALLLALQLAARRAELVLVAGFLLAVAAVYVLSIVGVVQRDLRRTLDHLGTVLSRGGTASRPERSDPARIVAASMRHLQGARVGALVVVRGREPAEDHLRGGVALRGQVSEPLLVSLFDPRTPGHDGAVLLDGGTVIAFGAHLPLASEPPGVSRFGGTRHTAALGLSEECDALVIAVSEELGTIHVAHEGALEPVDAERLEARLRRFARQRAGASDPGPSFVRHAGQAALAACVSVSLWLGFTYSPDVVERTFPVAVAYQNLPGDWMLVDGPPDRVDVTLRGPAGAMTSLARRDLTVSFDLSAPRDGTNRIALTRDRLDLPSRVELVTATPSELKVKAVPLDAARVPVRVATVGRTPPPLRVETARPAPDHVTLLIPRGSPPPGAVVTEPVDLSAITGPSRIERALLLPTRGRLAPGEPGTVTVAVETSPTS